MATPCRTASSARSARTSTTGAAADRAACVASLAFPNADDDGDGLLNAWEKCKWGSSNAAINTDGDALGDCKEVMDVNGNSMVTASDSTLIRQAVFGIIFGDLAAMDINAHGTVNASDSTLILQRCSPSVRACDVIARGWCVRNRSYRGEFGAPPSRQAAQCIAPGRARGGTSTCAWSTLLG